jgi:hypothetical protein
MSVNDHSLSASAGDKPADIILPVRTRLPVLLNGLSAANVQLHLRPPRARGLPSIPTLS